MNAFEHWKYPGGNFFVLNLYWSFCEHKNIVIYSDDTSHEYNVKMKLNDSFSTEFTNGREEAVMEENDSNSTNQKRKWNEEDNSNSRHHVKRKCARYNFSARYG